jgi:hypothetical protein
MITNFFFSEFLGSFFYKFFRMNDPLYLRVPEGMGFIREVLFLL